MADETAAVTESGLDTSLERIEAEWKQIAQEQGFKLNDSGSVQEPTEQPPEVEVQEITPIDDNAKGRIQGLLNILTFRLFKWFLPGFGMTEGECFRLNDVWSKVAAKYLPASWVRWIPASKDGGESVCIELDAVFVTIDIVEPRFEHMARDSPGQPQKSYEPVPPSAGAGGGQFDWETK